MIINKDIYDQEQHLLIPLVHISIYMKKIYYFITQRLNLQRKLILYIIFYMINEILINKSLYYIK